MKSEFPKTVFYDPKFDEQLLAIEREAVQGTWIKLEMLRDTYLSRSTVFKDWKIGVVINEAEEVIGALAIAIVSLQVDDEVLTAAIGYDARVRKGYQKQGIGKQMGAFMDVEYVKKMGIEYIFITAKASNKGAINMGRVLAKSFHTYDFVYLTIPTQKRLKKPLAPKTELCFQPTLFGDTPTDYVTTFSSGMKIWHTHKMYSLRIQKVHPLAKIGLFFARWFNPVLRETKESSELRFATLFDYDYDSLEGINEVLENLEQQNIHFLNVCCKKNDAVYQTLQPLSISNYAYLIAGDFEIHPESKVRMDVRCL